MIGLRRLDSNELIRASMPFVWALAAVFLAAPSGALAQAGAPEGESGPEFSKAFDPGTIGPGSVSMLIFTIDNSGGSGPVEEMAFTDELPFGMDLAEPAFVSNTCGGTLTAPDGGDEVSLVDGDVGVTTCEIVVNVIGTTDCGGLAPEGGGPVECDNTTGDLTSTAGNSGDASATLFVDTDRPGFSKSFDESTVEFGGRSTLTFTIDNSATGGNAVAVNFTDTLPAGMVVADPSNVATDDCFAGVVTAVPGTGVISFNSGSVLNGDTCTIDVDVIGGAVGSLGNVSDELMSGSASQVSSGKAAAVLEVTGFVDPLTLEKEFTDDPTPPGGTVTLEFTLTNQDRDFPATGLAFDDDLGTALAGLAPSGPLPTDPCGAGSALSFTPGTPPAAVLSLTGGSLPPEGSCTFGVALDVPGGTAPGAYPNTTTAVTGTIDGMPETGNMASDLLFVVSFPILTKTFTDDPVGAGGTVTLEFSITNPETTSVMSGITFVDELTGGAGDGGTSGGFLPFPVSVTLPPVPDPPCGGLSSLALVSLGTDRQGLELTGGSLAAGGMPGDSCTFSVTIDIPDGFSAGTYTNTTEGISGVLDDLPGPPTALGPPASDDVVIAGAPRLTKEFVDDPVLPAGGPVTLEFNLVHDETAPGDATDVAFTDDLDTLSPPVPGLVASSVDTNTCAGSTVDITTDPSVIDFSDPLMVPGEECMVVVTLTVPAASPAGFHTNTTSDVTATIDIPAEGTGIPVTGNPAVDDLLITPLVFTKEFVGDPVIAGDTLDLTFTIENLSAAAASSVIFDDDLDAVLPGTPDLTVVTLPTLPPACGAGAVLIESFGTLTFAFGEIGAGGICSFTVEIMVPTGVADDAYANVTSSLSSSLGTVPPAIDELIVQSNLLALSKEFTDDPVSPGDPVTLEFTLENLSGSDTVTDIAFDDDLDATLSGLTLTSELFNDCGGTVSGTGTGLFEYDGGSLGPSATCTVRLLLTLPGGPIAGSVFPNTTTSVAGKVGTLDVFGDEASDELDVQLLTFSKSFDGPTTATGTAVLTFTLENLDSGAGASPLAFSDDLDAVLSGLEATVLPPNPVCDTGTIAGTSFLTVTGASLDPSGACSFDVTVTVPPTATAGSFLNTTSDLSESGLSVAEPATAFLDIEPPPTFAKEFIPDSIPQGAVSTLVFTIDNTASSLSASSLDFTDTLPAGVEVATPPAASTTCTGGTITAVAGSGVISYTGGSVGATASCTVEADVTASLAGMYVNTTGDLTSSSGVSGTATDTLEVIDALPPQVTNVDSILGTGDGELEECETARTTVTALTATFSEAMFEAAPTDPNSVTNPDNWLIVGSGPDQDLSTTVCGPTVDDDVATPIDEVTYDGGSLTATVTFDEVLADGPYRLIACSGGLIDLSSNALDGDADGGGGDDFVRYFRIDHRDAFVHGNFDCTLDDWITSSPAEIFFQASEDVDAAGISGSVGFANSIGNFDLSIGQCVELLPESIYELSGSVRLNTVGVMLDLITSCELFASDDCSGPGAPAEAFFASLTTPLVWQSFANEVLVLDGFNSGLCQLTLRSLAGQEYSANADDLSMDAIFTMILFRDGFESGDTSAWSTTVP